MKSKILIYGEGLHANLQEWQEKIKSELERFREDPSYRCVLPIKEGIMTEEHIKKIEHWAEEIMKDLFNIDFDEIDEPIHEDPLVCGLMKLSRLLKGKITTESEESEIVYLNGLEDLKEKITKEDMLYLARCGIFVNVEDLHFEMSV